MASQLTTFRACCLGGVAAAILLGWMAPARAETTGGRPAAELEDMSSSGAYLASGFAVSEHDLEAADRLMCAALPPDSRHPRLLHPPFVLALVGERTSVV